MKKLCIIIYKYNNEGGIEKVVRNLIKGLIDKYEIHIITSEIKDIQDNRIIFHKIKLFTNLWILRWIQFFFLSYLKFKKLNKIYNFDIIHKHTISLIKSDVFTAHSVHKVALKTNIKLQKGIIEKIKYFIFSLYPLSVLFEYINLRRSKRIIAISTGIKEELISNYKISSNKIIIIPNGINIKDCPFVQKKYDNDLNLVFVGKRFKAKGLDIVIEALDIVVNKHKIKNLKLFVVGNDEVNFEIYKNKAINLKLENNIVFVGHTKNVYKYYNLSHIFILPTYYEAFGMAIIEASLCGLAILTSKTHGPKDVIKDGYNGYLLERDPRLYADKIMKLYNNRKLLKTLGSNARKYVIENYSWDKIVKNYIKLYNDFF